MLSNFAKLKFCPENNSGGNNYYQAWNADYHTHWATHQRYVTPCNGLMTNEANVVYLTSTFHRQPDERAHLSRMFGVNLCYRDELPNTLYVPGTDDKVTKASIPSETYLQDGSRVFIVGKQMEFMGTRVYATWMGENSCVHTPGKVSRMKRMPAAEKAWLAEHAALLTQCDAVYALDNHQRREAGPNAKAMFKGGPVTPECMAWVGYLRAHDKKAWDEFRVQFTSIPSEHDYLCTKPFGV